MSESIARPLAEWHEDEGTVLWWKFPVSEAPYVGRPDDLGFTVTSILYNQHGDEIGTMRADVGGWPGYHTHWTPMVKPAALPKGTRVRLIVADNEFPAGSEGVIHFSHGSSPSVAFDVSNPPGSASFVYMTVDARRLELAPEPEPTPPTDDDILF